MNSNADFRPSDKVLEGSGKIARPSTIYWEDALHKLKQNPVAMISLFVIISLIVLSIAGSAIRGLDYEAINVKDKNLAPNSNYWFGTDKLGRDLFSQLWAGLCVSLVVSIVCGLVQVILGSIIGSVMTAGFNRQVQHPRIWQKPQQEFCNRGL